MTMGEEELSAPLVVLKDPASSGTDADIQNQFRVILQLREETNAVVDLINEAESIRAQLVDLSELLRGREGMEDVLSASQNLDDVLIELEMGLTDLRMSGGTAGQDALRWPRQLFAKLTSLAGYIGGSDFPPTDQHLEVHRRLQGLLRDAQSRMEEIRGGELRILNELMEGQGIPHIISGGMG
jgi:hypothetical protein